MITVSNDFKLAAKSDITEIKAIITDLTTSDTFTDSDDLVSVNISAESSITHSVMREALIVVNASHDFLDKYINIQLGVMVNGTPTYINYGDFICREQTTNQANGEVTLKCYDRMFEALQEYDLEAIYDITYPSTLTNFVDTICTRLGWTNGVSGLVNGTESIADDLFLTLQMSFRDVLDQVAEASGSILYFQGNTLKNRAVDVAGATLETLTTSDQLDLTTKSEYGPVNSIVLSRMPQQDNVAQQDAGSIAIHGTNEYKIVNNYIVDQDRATWITDIYGVLNGLTYYPFKANVGPLGYFEIGDKIKVTDTGDVERTVIVTKYIINWSTGGSVTLEGKVPNSSTTPYQYAGIVGKKTKDVEIKVDKQQGQIDLLVTQVATATIPRQSTPPVGPSVNDLYLDTDDNIIYIWDGATWQPTSISPSVLDGYYTIEETDVQISLTESSILSTVETTTGIAQSAQELAESNTENITTVQSQITQIQQDIDSIDLTISGVGGINLLENSTGLKGTIEEWQEFDENGNLIDADNSGTIVNTADVRNNSESGSGIQLNEQFITQTFPTLAGNTYTFRARFKRNGACTLTISGIPGTQSITVDSYTNDTWAVYKYQFTAVGTNTTITLTNVGVTGAYIILADMIVKIGDATGWTPGPNEVYGSNYKFGRDGLSISSVTNDFVSTLDEQSLTIRNEVTDTIIIQISKDSALLSNVILQDEVTIRRYDNSSKALRFIPRSDGVIEIIND